MKNFKKSVSLILSVVMLLGCISVTVFAADSSVTVNFSAFDGKIIMPRQSLTVSDGTAEAYGYQNLEKDHNGVKIEGITALDVLVTAHKAYYGDLFTAETASDYLSVVNGQLKLAFGKSAAASSFAVNNAAPHDDIYLEDPVWGSAYTGYAINEARISDGDYIAYFFYQDKYFYGDKYAWFTNGENMADSVTVLPEEEITLTLIGFTFGWYSTYKDEDKDISPLPYVDVYLVKNGEYTLLGQTDEEGTVTLSIAEEGDYQLCAYGETEDDYDDGIPVAAAWSDIKVQSDSQTASEKSLWERIVDFFRMIFDFIANLFR